MVCNRISRLLHWVCFCLIVAHGYEYDPNSIPHTDVQKLKNLISSGNHQSLVFFYTDFAECIKCKELMPKFHEAVEYLNKLEDGKVVSYKIAIKFPEYGVTTFPQLIFFHDDSSFLYDGRGSWEPDEIIDWLEEAKQTPVQELTDETFEHLTQASTGATTGDWIVLFADGSRPECMRPNLPALGTVGVRLRMRKNAAYVDINRNPKTFARFEDVLKTKCAAMLFFHRTELYTIPDKDYSTAAVLQFVLEDYVHAEHVNVPPEESEKHSQIDDAVEALKNLLEAYIYTHTIHAGVLVLLLALLIGVIFFLVKKFTKKKIL